MAPEMLLVATCKDAPLGPALDIWSLGVCLFELAAGYKPFQVTAAPRCRLLEVLLMLLLQLLIT